MWITFKIKLNFGLALIKIKNQHSTFEKKNESGKLKVKPVYRCRDFQNQFIYVLSFKKIFYKMYVTL